jgi:tetratricopeptide (TPR) repeat protein
VVEQDGQRFDLRNAQGMQVGDGNIQVNIFTRAARARLRPNAYLEQVRRIAPPALTGRNPELAELARFCLAPDAPDSRTTRYSWWQAGPWAGKSALMSTFVACPPAEVLERVRIVSFFITARLAAQDTREAFIEVVLEQLGTLLGKDLPAILPEATQDAYFLDLMREAAASCRAEGGRLILLVDGLDEDRGVTSGPCAHSIAALLPADPPAGMRVIVASRPDPGIPDDVPDWHPLRDPAIIRPLAPSPHARGIRQRSSQELRRLLRGSPAGQDIVGLLAAARGGLTAPDLAELAGVPLWDIEDILRTTAARTFACRPSPWGRGDRPGVYLLGHEELQTQAETYFRDRLPSLRDRLHAWADLYRGRGWPADTPEYLLSGYFRLLADLGDLSRTSACVTDAARQDRMLDLTGGDVMAIAEARTVLGRIAAQDTPDLGAALAAAYRLDELSGRNQDIPHALPAAWAAVGEISRALALVRSVAEAATHPEALAELAPVLASAGHVQDAAAVACSITDPYQRAGALARTAEALTRAGRSGPDAAIAVLAVRTARSISDPGQQAAALGVAAGALAAAGADQEAAAVADAISLPYERCCALALIGKSLAMAGNDHRAAAIANRAEAIARSIDDANHRPDALSRIAEVLAGAGQDHRAQVIASQVETSFPAMTDPALRVTTAAHIAGARARAGDPEETTATIRSLFERSDPNGPRAGIVTAIAEAGHHDFAMVLARSLPGAEAQVEAATQLARIGLPQTASAIAAEAAESARLITLPDWRHEVTARIALVLASSGQPERASVIATQVEADVRGIIHSFQLHNLNSIIVALGQAGKPELAGTLAARAEAAAWSFTDDSQRSYHLGQVAVALTSAGLYERAQALIKAIIVPLWLVQALEGATRALADAGDRARAVAAARQAEVTALNINDDSAKELAARALARAGLGREANGIARMITNPSEQDEPLDLVAGAYAEAGDLEEAEAIARGIADPSRRAYALALIAGKLAKAGRYEEAATIATDSVAETIAHPGLQRATFIQAARALLTSGQLQSAIAVAGKTDLPQNQVACLLAVADELTETGRHQEALTVLDTALATVSSIDPPVLQVSPLAKAAGVLAHAGKTSDAARLAARVCAIGGWTMVVGPVLKIAPEAAGALEQVIRGNLTPVRRN